MFLVGPLVPDTAILNGHRMSRNLLERHFESFLIKVTVIGLSVISQTVLFKDFNI